VKSASNLSGVITPMTRSAKISGAQIHHGCAAAVELALAKCGWWDTSPITCGRLERRTWTLRFVVVELEPDSEQRFEVGQATPADDHQALSWITCTDALS
jgi:hypothetical protein